MVIVLLSACRSAPVDNCEVLSFDEADYNLVKTSKDGMGNKYSELYINKKESSIELKKIFWENGKQQSIVFFSKGKKTGPSILLDSSGVIIYEGFYFQDKEMGVVIKYDSYGKKAVIRTLNTDGLLNQHNLK